MRFITQKQAEIIDVFERAIVAAYKVPLDVIKGRGRQDHVASVRHILWRALKEHARLSTVFLGDRYDRDHTTVSDGIQRAREGYLASEYAIFVGHKTGKLGTNLGIRPRISSGKAVEKAGMKVHNFSKKR